MTTDKDKIERNSAMQRLVRSMGTTNLIGTDFELASAVKVETEFIQDPGNSGVLLQFAISNHAIGKLDGAGHDALITLLPEYADEQEDIELD